MADFPTPKTEQPIIPDYLFPSILKNQVQLYEYTFVFQTEQLVLGNDVTSLTTFITSRVCDKHKHTCIYKIIKPHGKQS